MNLIIAEKVVVASRYHHHLFRDTKLPLPDGGGADLNVVASGVNISRFRTLFAAVEATSKASQTHCRETARPIKPEH